MTANTDTMIILRTIRKLKGLKGSANANMINTSYHYEHWAHFNFYFDYFILTSTCLFYFVSSHTSSVFNLKMHYSGSLFI